MSEKFNGGRKWTSAIHDAGRNSHEVSVPVDFTEFSDAIPLVLRTNSAFPGLFPSTYGPDEAFDEWSVNRRCTSAQNQPCIFADQIDLAPSMEQTLTHRASQLAVFMPILIVRNVRPTLTLARQRRDETSMRGGRPIQTSDLTRPTNKWLVGQGRGDVVQEPSLLVRCQN